MRNLGYIMFAAALAVVGAVALSGCSTAQQAAIDIGLAQSEAGIKAFNDREAIALKQAPCAMRIGAFNRVLTAREKDAVMALCQGEESLTFDDLMAMGEAIKLLRDAAPRTFQDAP
jgi:hypothetical protein